MQIEKSIICKYVMLSYIKNMVKERFYMKIAVVGCTGKLGSSIMKNIQKRDDVTLAYAIAREGNALVGKSISAVIGGQSTVTIIGDVCQAQDADVFIDCTSAKAFMETNLIKYKEMKKPVVIGTTAFTDKDMEQIKAMAEEIPVFLTGNFSIALHDFIETLEFAVKRISKDTDIQIVEYHHNQKKDAPSGTALMIRDALVKTNQNVKVDKINICSVRGGNIFGEHEVIFANEKDEVTTYRHEVSSRETFADGAIEVSIWMVEQKPALYNMDDFCEQK